MPDGPGGFSQDFTCPGLLRIPLGISAPRVRGCHPVSPPFPGAFRFAGFFHVAVLLPRNCRNSPGLGYSPVARRYWGNHCCFLLLRVLRCFSSPRSPPLRDGTPSACRVAPFGNPRIKGHLRLRAAYRSLSRPSSPPGARASTVRPCSLMSVFVVIDFASIARFHLNTRPPLPCGRGRSVPLVVVSLSSMSKNGVR